MCQISELQLNFCRLEHLDAMGIGVANPDPEPEYQMVLPAANSFLDINNDSHVPRLNFLSIETYLSNQGKRLNVKKSMSLYEDG